MPRKPKLPKPFKSGGVSQFDLRDKKRNKYPNLNKYPPEILNPICEKHQIVDKTLQDKLWHELEYRYISYQTALNRKKHKASYTEIRNQINKLEKLLSDFIGEWDQLHPDTEYWLHKAVHEFYFPNPKDLEAMLKSGAATRSIDISGKERTFFHKPDVSFPELHFLEHEFAKAKALLPKNEDDHELHLPLYDFVSGMARFWISELKRPFTIDTHEGKGLTTAREFLEDCIQPIDPSLVSSLPEMMERVRRDLYPTP
jgi:hypothetical protein